MQQALELDPTNIEVAEHLHELADDAVRRHNRSRSMKRQSNTLGEAPSLEPIAGSHSFHLQTDRRR